jgi:hypothetical protein
MQSKVKHEKKQTSRSVLLPLRDDMETRSYIGIRDPDLELVLERHAELDLIERVEAEVVGEGRRASHLESGCVGRQRQTETIHNGLEFRASRSKQMEIKCASKLHRITAIIYLVRIHLGETLDRVENASRHFGLGNEGRLRRTDCCFVKQTHT